MPMFVEPNKILFLYLNLLLLFSVWFFNTFYIFTRQINLTERDYSLKFSFNTPIQNQNSNKIQQVFNKCWIFVAKKKKKCENKWKSNKRKKIKK